MSRPGADDAYRQLLELGTRPFFEAVRSSCPWCEGPELEPVIDTGDLAQHKPGRFHLDRCRRCGHVFQNPRLSPEGLAFYYRDFYDGPYRSVLTRTFETDVPRYRDRVELVRRHYMDGEPGEPSEPGRWLDVGTGFGHFCLTAREQLPATRFEALDRGDSVLDAARKGWIDRAHQGELPALADGLAGRFDVVSMHHYLEHVPEPRQHLAAARRTLRPGGYLSIELPDPECWAGRALGRWWGPWFQPQHLHMLPIDNLCRALREEGFTVVAREQREAHEPLEATVATYLFLHALAPPPDTPWRASPRTAGGASARAWRSLVFLAATPILVLAYLTDRLAAPLVRRLPTGPNAYRVLARLSEPAPFDAPIEPSNGAPSDGGVAAGWERGLLEAISGVVGVELACVDGPRPVEGAAHMPGRFVFELAAVDGSPLPSDWTGPSVVRLAPDRSDLEREVVAAHTARHRGVLVPRVRGVVELEDRWALVTERPSGRSLLELIGRDFGRFDELLTRFAVHHADIHDRTADLALPPGGAVPHGDPAQPAHLVPLVGGALPVVDDLEAEIGRIDAGRYPEHVAWLRAEAGPAGPPVLCHGAYEPMCVTGTATGTESSAPAAASSAASTPRSEGLVVSNWAGAVVAERELDVGQTLMSFWVAPVFVEHRALRAQFKMIRNKLASRYLRGYGDRALLDKRRVSWWEAFHALRALAQLQGAYDAAGSPFADAAGSGSDRRTYPKGLEKELERLFRIVTARERRGRQGPPRHQGRRGEGWS